jgi:hypothetical protein
MRELHGLTDAERLARAAIVDEFGELKRRIQEHKPDVDRAQALAKIIQSWYQHEKPEQAFVAEGEAYTLQVSPRGMVRTITDLWRVYRILGKDKFFELAHVGLSYIDAEIPAEKHAAFLVQSQTGDRRLVAVAKSPQKKLVA